MFKEWERLTAFRWLGGCSFCREVLQRPSDPEVDALERHRQVRDRDLQVFFWWRLHTENVRKVDTLLNIIKNWNMMYRDEVGRAAAKDMIKRINTVPQPGLL